MASFPNMNECVNIDKTFFISMISVSFINITFEEYWTEYNDSYVKLFYVEHYEGDNSSIIFVFTCTLSVI